MSSKPGIGTYIRDAILFVVGVWITIGQTGFPKFLDMPADGPNVWALLTGVSLCNGPMVLQALALRFGGGTSSSAPSPEPLLPAPPSAQSSGQSSGGE